MCFKGVPPSKINKFGGSLAIMGPPGEQKGDGRRLKYSSPVLGGGRLRSQATPSCAQVRLLPRFLRDLEMVH